MAWLGSRKPRPRDSDDGVSEGDDDFVPLLMPALTLRDPRSKPDQGAWDLTSGKKECGDEWVASEEEGGMVLTRGSGSTRSPIILEVDGATELLSELIMGDMLWVSAGPEVPGEILQYGFVEVGG